MFKVKATAQGQYGGILQSVGTSFSINAVEDYSTRWMETDDPNLIKALKEMEDAAADTSKDDDFDVNDLMTENEKLADTVSEQAEQISTLQAEKDGMATEIEKLKKQLSTQKGEVAKLQNQLADKKAE